MKNLLQYFNGYKKESILAPLLKLAEAILELFTPLIVSHIIDRAIPSGESINVYKYIGLMVLTTALGFTWSIIAQHYSAKASSGYTRNLSKDLFSHIAKLSQTQRDSIGQSSLINALTSDMTQIDTGLNRLFRLVLRSPFIVLGALIMAMRIDIRMTSNFLLMIILLFAVVVGIMVITNPLHAQIRSGLDKLVTISREQMQGIRVIRAFRQESREIKTFQKTNEQLTKDQKATGLIDSLVNPLTYLIVNLTLIFVIWKGANLVSVNQLSQGQLVALVNYLSQILVELIKTTVFVSMLNRAIVSAKRVNNILTTQPESDKLENNPSYFTNDNNLSIVIRNLDFTYPKASKPSLKNINIDIKEGDFIGVIGGTGSGKTSLMNLICRIYEPTSGDLSYNPAVFDLASKSKLRDQISVVPGQVNLFKGTIRSNLLLANPKASSQQMWQALEDAQAKDFVEKLDQGLDSPVASYGRNFSGGQRQRLTIARALLKPAKLYIFDDSTSALDYLTEARFLEVIRNKYADKTVIIISQRTRSLINVDQILVLDHGEQVGLASHEELLASNRVYQEIHQSQLVEEVD